MGGCEKLNKAKPFLLMVALQCGSAGLYIISDVFLKQGMSRYVLMVYRNAIAAITLAPFAYFIERQIRPKLTVPIFLKIMSLAILEIALEQNLGNLGMKLTSATFTSAIFNAVPAVTFALAVILRMEVVKIKEVRSQAKVIGTLVTLAGALLMTLYKGPIIDLIWSPKTSHFINNSSSSDKNWIMGTFYLVIACVASSGFCILQSITLQEYPAGLSVVFLIGFLGAIMAAALTLLEERRPGVWAVGFDSRLLAPLYAGIVTSGISFYVQGLVMRTRDAVFVTAFKPLCMIIVAILGSILLAEKIRLGSIIGGIIIVLGLYAVLWGKSKDHLQQITSTKESRLPVSMEKADDDKIFKETSSGIPLTVVTDDDKIEENSGGMI